MSDDGSTFPVLLNAFSEFDIVLLLFHSLALRALVLSRVFVV